MTSIVIKLRHYFSSLQKPTVNIKNLCLLRLSAIGDVCHAVAMVERIQRAKPDIKITWIIGKIEYQLVKDIPDIRFIIFDKSQGKQAFRDLENSLAGEKFDAMFLMQVALRANLAARLVKAKVKIGFDWHRSKELHWLFANKRIEAQQHAHVLDGFMAFADALEIPKLPSINWHIPVSDEDLTWAKEQVADLGKFVVISPAASKKERNWLPERYARVADYIQQKGLTVVLCGGPGSMDRELGDAIQSSTTNVAKDFIGKTSLKQNLALLSLAELVIAPDTGPAHMATTVGTSVIGLYAHSNPRRTGPYNSLDHVVSVYDQVIQEQKGKSWQALPWGARAKGDSLMSLIETDQVCQQIDKVLGTSQ